jgi:hypothetical protein
MSCLLEAEEAILPMWRQRAGKEGDALPNDNSSAAGQTPQGPSML